MSKLIVVLGATGNQGGSVAKTFLNTPGWSVRAVTRNTSSDKAKALASNGAELAQANLDDPASLAAAFQGAHAVFAVSDFWGIHGDLVSKEQAKPWQALSVDAAERETQQLKNVVHAAAGVVTLERFVLSSLANVTKWSKGKFKQVFHFDSKAKATEYTQETYPDLWKKTSIYQAGFYLSNFISIPFLGPVKSDKGVYQFAGTLDLDTKLPLIAPEEDSGPIVKALIDVPAGKNVIGYREWLTISEFADIFAKATGFEAEAVRIPDMTEMEGLAFINEIGYEARDDPSVVHPKDLETPPQLDTVANYIKKNNWAEKFQ